MKNVKLLLLSIVLVLGCSDSNNKIDDETDNELIGDWVLTEYYSDPGDGSGDFIPVASHINATLSFQSNGVVTSNSNLFNPFQDAEGGISESAYDIETSTILINDCEVGAFGCINFYIENNYLILSYPCIEACLGKFVKVDY